MADSKISALPASTTPLAGTEVLPIVQSSATKQVSVANLTAGRAVSASSLTASTGDITSTAGNFVVGTSGKGIDFSATSGTGTSELLADYEEGTWTPSLGGTTTYLAQGGTYTKIGRVVNFYCVLYINAIGTGSVTNIGGLPFSAGASTGQGTVTILGDCNTLISYLVGYVNSAQITLKGTTVTSAAISDISVFKALTYIEIFGSYPV